MSRAYSEPRWIRETRLAYADYRAGMPTVEVAAKYGVPLDTLLERFRREGCELVRRDVRQSIPSGSFTESNALRTAVVGPRQACRAAEALRWVDYPRFRSALALRASHPDASIAELAALHDPPMTKAAFWSLLRRALERADLNRGVRS